MPIIQQEVKPLVAGEKLTWEEFESPEHAAFVQKLARRKEQR